MVAESKELHELRVSDDIRQNSELLDLVNGANRVLLDVLGPSAQIARAEWSLEYHNGDPGLPVIVIRLSDPWGSSVARFTERDLSQPNYVWNRLYRLWGDVLSNTYDRNMEAFREVVSRLSEG